MKVVSLLKAALMAGACIVSTASHAQMPPTGSGCWINGNPKHVGGPCSDDFTKIPRLTGTVIQSPGCPTGQVASGGVCVDLTTTVTGITSTQCRSGYVLSGNSCVLIPNPSVACASGQVASGGACVPIPNQVTVPVLTYDCPIPTGGQDSYDPDTGAYYMITFASMTMANRLTGPNACYYFVTGNINSNGYLPALSSQFKITHVDHNQDYGRVEISTTARKAAVCPSGTTLVGDITLVQNLLCIKL